MNALLNVAFLGFLIMASAGVLPAHEEQRDAAGKDAVAGETGITAKLIPSGFVSLREGQVVEGEADDRQEGKYPQTNHVWVQELYTGFNIQTAFTPYPLTGNIGLELKICNEYPRYRNDFGKSRRLYFYPYLSRADLVYQVGNSGKPALRLDLGYFPFKYNGDAKNLGEYLFRTGTYPQYILTEFEFPMTRMLGLHAGGNAFGKISWDILATTNIEWAAIGDLNLACITSVRPWPIFELGAGAAYFSLLSMDQNYTSPKIRGATDIVKSITRRQDGSWDTLRSWYTYAGAKLMGRLSLDLKPLIPASNLFGGDDLKIFAEAAVLGVKSYDPGIPAATNGYYTKPDPSRPGDSLFVYFVDYSEIKRRVPVMVGINVPTFKVLDVLSIQAEWFGSRFPNDLTPLVIDNQPVPLSSYTGKKDGYSPEHYKNDDWKWSVYGSKTLLNHFHVSVQFARDHMRWYRMSFSEQEWEEALRQNKDWYWTAKAGYSF
jgi:hypothetical protein